MSGPLLPPLQRDLRLQSLVVFISFTFYRLLPRDLQIQSSILKTQLAIYVFGPGTPSNHVSKASLNFTLYLSKMAPSSNTSQSKHCVITPSPASPVCCPGVPPRSLGWKPPFLPALSLLLVYNQLQNPIFQANCHPHFTIFGQSFHPPSGPGPHCVLGPEGLPCEEGAVQTGAALSQQSASCSSPSLGLFPHTHRKGLDRQSLKFLIP